MNISVRTIGCTGIVLIAVAAGYIPIPSLNVPELAQQADLIVVGQITSVTPKEFHTAEIAGQTVRVQTMHGEMHVDQTLKGSINSSRVEFIFELPDAPVGYKSISPSSYRIAFLNKTQSGYSLTSAYYPTLCAVPGVRANGTDILANLSRQLDGVLERAGSNYQEKREALNALKTLKTPIANAALKRALEDKALDLRLLASAALLERNDISGLSIGESVLTTRSEAVPDYLLHNIAYAISEGMRDPRAVPTLGKLLRLPNVETRRAAASALWHTASHAAAPFLATALEDGDFEVRYYAVIGLAEIADQPEWHPNMEVFRAEEGKYLQHWREWSLLNHMAAQAH
jgi:hypothetical protein